MKIIMLLFPFACSCVHDRITATWSSLYGWISPLCNSLQLLHNNVPEAILSAAVYEERTTVNGPRRDFGWESTAGTGRTEGSWTANFWRLRRSSKKKFEKYWAACVPRMRQCALWCHWHDNSAVSHKPDVKPKFSKRTVYMSAKYF